MQKPKFRTADKSAWVFVTTQLNKRPVKAMSRRAALRCGYLAGAANRLGVEDARALPTPHMDEPMSAYIARVKAAQLQA